MPIVGINRPDGQQDPREDDDLVVSKVQPANTGDALDILQTQPSEQANIQTQSQSQFLVPFPVPNGYRVTGDGVFKYSKKDAWEFVCPYMGIVERYKDKDAGKELYKLEYKESPQEQSQYIRASSAIFSRTGIEELATKGIFFPSGNKNKVIDYLSSQKSTLKAVQVYSGAGWEEQSNDMFPANGQDINPNKTAFWGATRLSRDGVEGVNDGSKYDMNPAGTSEAWLKLFKEEVAGNIALEFAVILGLSATLVPILSQWTTDLRNLFCHIVGQSTTGKTTAAALATSVAGRPATTNNGLLRTWNTTQNALTIMLNGNHGVPLVLDELSMIANGKVDLTSLVYQLADGSEKSRATQNAGLKETRSWSTTIISTGELKVTDCIKQNDGLLVRILELKDVQFTSSAEQSERIKEEANKNYGWATPDFVSKLQQLPITDLHQYYEEAVTFVSEILPVSKFRKRLASKIAVLPLTAMLANGFWGWKISLKGLVEFIVAHMSEDWTVPVGQRALQDVMEVVISQQGNFRVENSPYVTSRNFLGSIWLKNDYIAVNILRNKMRAILADLEYQDTSTIFNQWVKAKVLVPDKDRKTRRVEFKGERVAVYSLHISLDYIDDFIALKELHDEEIERMEKRKLADEDEKEFH